MPQDDLTPEEEQVRRLLADARHTEPMPDDVAARLDEVLAGLRDGSEPAPTSVRTPPAVDLAAARRRRRVRSLLAAAAALIAVGVGVDRLATVDVGSGGVASSTAGDSAESDTSARRPHDRDDPAAASQDAAGALSAEPEVRLRADRFGAQVADMRRHLRVYASMDDENRPGPGTDGRTRHQTYGQCDGDWGAHWGAGRVVPVRYDGHAGVVVFRAVRGDTQVVDLFLCGRDGASRSITLPAP